MQFCVILFACCFHIEPGSDYSIVTSNDCLQLDGNNNSFLVGNFSYTWNRCCLNIIIADDNNQEEMVIELNVTLSNTNASSLLPIDIKPDVFTVVIVDDDRCGKLQSHNIG